MVDLTEEERAAITATMKRVALLMDEIGWATPLGELTEAQVRALIDTNLIGSISVIQAALPHLRAAVPGLELLPLPLVGRPFYHLDTALCPLPCGGVIYHPGAFTEDARAAIELRVTPGDRIALDPADAALFAANAVCFGRVIVMSSCSEALQATLERRGYTVVTTLLNAFLRSGGSACCLTLRLDRSSRAVEQDALVGAMAAQAE